jgi:hypothetical protein
MEVSMDRMSISATFGKDSPPPRLEYKIWTLVDTTRKEEIHV